MSFDNYSVSRTTLDRLESVFKEGYLQMLNKIANSPDFFNGTISGDELYEEFVREPISEIKQKEKHQKEEVRAQNYELKTIKMAKHQTLSRTKCHALIHIKHELRQCQNNQLHDDDFCVHHSVLDVLPYGRVIFTDDNSSNDES